MLSCVAVSRHTCQSNDAVDNDCVMLQYIAVCCKLLQCHGARTRGNDAVDNDGIVLQFVVMCCSVLQFYSTHIRDNNAVDNDGVVLQSVAVCCSVMAHVPEATTPLTTMVSCSVSTYRTFENDLLTLDT